MEVLYRVIVILFYLLAVLWLISKIFISTYVSDKKAYLEATRKVPANKIVDIIGVTLAVIIVFFLGLIVLVPIMGLLGLFFGLLASNGGSFSGIFTIFKTYANLIYRSPYVFTACFYAALYLFFLRDMYIMYASFKILNHKDEEEKKDENIKEDNKINKTKILNKFLIRIIILLLLVFIGLYAWVTLQRTVFFHPWHDKESYEKLKTIPEFEELKIVERKI